MTPVSPESREQTDEDWQRLTVNMTGVFNTCRAVITHMRGRKYAGS